MTKEQELVIEQLKIKATMLLMENKELEARALKTAIERVVKALGERAGA